jgi:hypothetical protein
MEKTYREVQRGRAAQRECQAHRIMASENSKRLQRALAPGLKIHGSKKSGATWRRDGPDAIEPWVTRELKVFLGLSPGA